jgi:hypothetical protein
MTDRVPRDDDDDAWLLARERGEPMPPISDRRARQYAQLDRLLADLPAVPAGTVQREGWKQTVLAAFDAAAGQPADPTRAETATATEASGPNEPSAAKRRRRRIAAATAAVFAIAAGVAIVVFLFRDHRQEVGVIASAPDVDPRQAGRPGPPQEVPEVTRGLHIVQGRLGFDPAIQVRRSDTAGLHELHDGDSVMTGDGIRASVRISADAYLYLAYCADQRLEMYPSQRGVRARAGDLVLLPEGGGELRVEDHAGSEVLYLILSRNELPLAAADLAAAVAATGDTSKAMDCGASLDSKLMKSTGVLPQTNVLRGERVPKKRMPSPRSGAPENPDPARSPGDIVWYMVDEADGSPVAVAADASGIAVVRYRFIHAAREHVDDLMDRRR